MPTMTKQIFGFWKIIVVCSLVLANLGHSHAANAASPKQYRQPDKGLSKAEKAAEEPYVLDVTPKGGFLKDRAANIKIIFSQPMDQKRTESSFSIQPDLAHQFQWSDPSTLQIKFTELFTPGTQYAMTLSSNNAVNLAGQSLSEDYRWYYWLDPFIINVATSDETQVTLKFETPIDDKRSGIPFEIQPKLEGEWEWDLNNTVNFTATKPIPKAREFTIKFTGQLYDQYGEINYGGPALTFTAPPPIRSMEPEDGDNISPDLASIKIVFTEPVDKASAQNAFNITPPMGGTFSWRQSSPQVTFEDELTFTPNALFIKGQSYTISISSSLKDRAGQPVMLSVFKQSFSVERYSYSSLPASFGEYGANIQVVDAFGPRKIQLAATGTVQFEAYQYDLMDFVKVYAEDFGTSYGLPAITLPDPAENRFAATWTTTAKGNETIRETSIPRTVSPGLYVLDMRHEGRSYSQLFVVLTRNNVVAKLSGNQLFVWVSDINGSSIEDAEVRLYSDRGEKIREGMTDEQGLFKVTVPEGYNPMLVSARVQTEEYTDVSLTGLTSGWYSDGYYYYGWDLPASDPAKYLVYTYTDRPIYKPGQTVNFKSIIRVDQDVKYSKLPANTPVKVEIRDPKSNLIQTTEIPLNEFGTLNGSFAITEGAVLGEYEIQVVVNGEGSQHLFQVEEYHKPDYQVSLAPTDPDQDNKLVAGEMLDLNIDVRYFFDEPVANAKLTYSYYELHPFYSWWDDDPEEVQYTWYPDSSNAGKLSTTTSVDGTAQISLRAPKFEEYEYSSLDDWRSSLRTKTYAVEVTADDGSNQPVSGTYIYTVVNASEKLKLDTLGYYKQPNESFTVQASVQSLSNQPIPNHALNLEIRKWDQTSYDYGTVLEKYSLITDATGLAGQEISLEAGYYQLSLNGTDSLGNRISYKRWLGVFSGKNDWYERTNSEIEISAEKETYKPYQTARFMIESSFSGPALLSFERGSVIHTKQVTLTAPLTVVEAQIIPEDAPNIFVTVNAWQPTEEYSASEEPEYYYTNIPDSRLRMARTELLVEADSKALEVNISTDKSVYAPGDPITVNIDVKDHDQKAVSAEVSLALVDEAIYSLSNDSSPNIFKAFYGPRSLSVDTFDSMSPYREIFVPGRGGGGGEGSITSPRSNFPDTAAWYPVLRTDGNGRASITFTLPDNITSWRLTSKAITLDHKVGESHINIEAKKDLLLRPFLPRTLVTGDQAELTVMVHNYAAVDRTVRVSLDAKELILHDDALQTVSIPAGGAALVGWSIIPSGTTATQLTFSALANDQSHDSIQLPMTIQPVAVSDVQSQSGTFTGKLELDLPVPADVLANNSLVTLRISRSPASTLLDGLEYLTGYPYGCVEQTMSRAMPNAVLGRASYQLGIGGTNFQGEIEPLIHASIQKLYGFQHADGGWGWWFDDSSDAYQSAWVLHGLAVIQSAGYSIDPEVIKKGAQYLQKNLDEMDERTQAYALYSMALAGFGDLEATRILAQNSLQTLDPFSQAALALALHQMGETDLAKAVLAVIEASSLHKESYIYWPQSQQDGEYHRKTMASTVRTTAFVLSALLKVDGTDNPFAKPAAEFLISQRNGYGWGTTNETSFTILALTDYLSAQQVQDGINEFAVNINGQRFSNGTLQPGRMNSNIDIPLSQLQPGNNQIRLESAGDAPLYYALITRYASSRKSVEKAGNIEISRQYLDAKTGKPLEQISLGQIVRVELTIQMPEAGSFILIEDRLPGGLEALNEKLNTTSHTSNYYEDGYDDTHYFWKEYGYNNKEIHDDRVSFFITEMKAETRKISYLARATTSGTFVALPVEVSAMYDPLLWGHSSSTIILIDPQK